MRMTRAVLGSVGLLLWASSPGVADTGPSVGAVKPIPPKPTPHAVTPHHIPPGGGNNGGGNNGGGGSGGGDLPGEPAIGGASAAFQPADGFALPDAGVGSQGPAGATADEAAAEAAAEVRADLTRAVLNENRKISGALVLVPGLGKGTSAPDGSLYAETEPQGPVNQNLFAVVGMGTPSIVANPVPGSGQEGESQYAGQEPETAPLKKPGEAPEGTTLPVKFKKPK